MLLPGSTVTRCLSRRLSSRSPFSRTVSFSVYRARPSLVSSLSPASRATSSSSRSYTVSASNKLGSFLIRHCSVAMMEISSTNVLRETCFDQGGGCLLG